jgi:uncharacterized protein
MMSEIISWWMRLIAPAPSWQRLLILVGTWIILWLPLAIPIAFKLQWRPFQPLAAAQKLPLLGPLYLMAPLVIWGLLTAQGKGWDYYGLFINRAAAGSVLVGLGLSIGSLAIVFGWEWSQGWLVWHPENHRQLLINGLPILFLALWIGVTEEVIFRGCLQTELATDYDWWIAGLLSSLIFAVLHLVWERQQTLPQIPGLILMGGVLTLAKMTDHGGLGLAIGLHAGWVWGLTCLDAAQLITYNESASPWLIGWHQQPLAGIAGFICLLGTAVSLFVISI